MTGSFEDLFERAPCGLLVTNLHGVIEQANSTFLVWTGYSASEVIGKTFRELLVVASQLFYETRFAPVLALNGEVREASLSVQRADASVLPVLVNSIAIDAGIRVAIFDSTQRQDYERELLAARREAETSETSMRILQDASSAFGSATNDTDLAGALVTSAREAFAAAAVAVRFFDETGTSWLAGGSDPVAAGLPANALRVEDEAASRSEIVTVLAGEVPYRFVGLAAAMDAGRVDMITVVPLLEEGAVTGTLTLFFARRRVFIASWVAFQHALARLAAQVQLRLRLQRELEHLALNDQLTGLASRKLLEQHLAQVLAASIQHSQPMSLVFLDLDGFKAINDRLGHATGDAVLVEVAQRLRRVVRAEDLIGRFGGDEFIVICEGADRDVSMALAERIRAIVAEPLREVPAGLAVTASIGVAACAPQSLARLTADTIFTAADSAMYESKASGKNQSTVVAL